MKNEGTERPMTLENEVEFLKETNAMQMALFKHWHGYNDEDKFVGEWIPKYSRNFRNILEEEIRVNPRLMEEWNDPTSREAVIERFGRKLYGQYYAKEVADWALSK